MNFRRPIQIGLLAASALMVSMALAQQGGPEGSTDHGAHHGAGAQQESQQAPGGMGQGGGMMGQGMMDKSGKAGAEGKGMMGRGMMGEDGKDDSKGMMDCPMMGGMIGKGMMGKKRGMMHSRPMMEARLAYIKADLEITEEQTTAWDAYADAVRARHATMEKMHADMKKAKESGNALERIDARIAVTEAKLESLKALKAPTEGLYTVLTDAQKDKADKLLGGGCPMM